MCLLLLRFCVKVLKGIVIFFCLFICFMIKWEAVERWCHFILCSCLFLFLVSEGVEESFCY